MTAWIERATTLAQRCSLPSPVGKVWSVPTGNETLLFSPRDVVSVAIDASGDGFYSYAYGVYSGTFDGAPDCSSDALDHAVVVVGYGAQLNGTLPFYIVRNSWGAASWGQMQGNVLFARGNNTCGIAQDATFVTLK